MSRSCGFRIQVYVGSVAKDTAFYYTVRDRFNAYQEPWDFLFITRTCMNGLIRFNREGKFNTSFHVGRPGIHPDTMDSIIRDRHQKLHGVVFISGDFTETLRTVTAEDFVYLDPPILPHQGHVWRSIRIFSPLGMSRKYEPYRGSVDAVL